MGEVSLNQSSLGIKHMCKIHWVPSALTAEGQRMPQANTQAGGGPRGEMKGARGNELDAKMMDIRVDFDSRVF